MRSAAGSPAGIVQPAGRRLNREKGSAAPDLLCCVSNCQEDLFGIARSHSGVNTRSFNRPTRSAPSSDLVGGADQWRHSTNGAFLQSAPWQSFPTFSATSSSVAANRLT